jgi:serine/threonine protein kinase
MLHHQFDDCGFTFLQFQNLLWDRNIGKGASGDVYLCEYKQMKCVGKCFYFRDYINQKGFIYDVYSELIIYRDLKELDSVSDIIGYSYDEVEEYFCIIMKYHSDKSLYDILKDPVNENDKKLITLEMCMGLKDIHDRNIIHCDIKPQNIIYHRETNKIKFIDFGASVKLTDKCETVEEGMGTEGYMSKELQFGTAYKKSDIYSFGVSLLELWISDLWYIKSDYRKDILFGIKKLEKTNKELADMIRKCVSTTIAKRPTIETLINTLIRYWKFDVNFKK